MGRGFKSVSKARERIGRKAGYRHFNLKVSPDPKFDFELHKYVRAQPRKVSFGSTRTAVTIWRRSFEELAQNGRGVERAARKPDEFLFCLAARMRALCASKRYAQVRGPGVAVFEQPIGPNLLTGLRELKKLIEFIRLGF